ncbi:putative two component system histidine kinase [Janibacter sp. HTCC2649]|uniref:sensor histidine kinase n=1 Tax=Janibacter sp. HTCC2649 TaxID=313589 RepID=UPI000066EBB8|nr:sensor histidine kinase [Janibacter sp. HTCC2649]EAP99418.1 putative two component system histidine kinase [Janibacter sp. HTCC2649]
MHRVMRTLTVVQHILFGVLAAVCVTRSWSTGAPRVPLVVAAVALLAWYAVGLRWGARSTDPSGSAVAGTHGRWWLLGLVACWLALVLVSSENVWLAFSLWLLIPHFFPVRWAVVISVGVLAVVIWRPWFETGGLTVAEALGPAIGALFAFALSRGQHQLVRDAIERQRLVDSLVKAQDEMAALHDELASSQREAGVLQERGRLSRDIHDTLAQGFSSIVLLARGRSVVAGEAGLTDLLTQIESTASSNLTEAREVVSALAPKTLSDSGLVQALGRIVDTLSRETGIATELRVEGEPLHLPTANEVALLRTAQGALANVRSHSGAGRVVVTLSGLEDRVLLEVVDDGRGFDPEAVAERAGAYSHGGYGLPSTRARLRELGGDLVLESAPGEGTALSAHLPLGTAR